MSLPDVGTQIWGPEGGVRLSLHQTLPLTPTRDSCSSSRSDEWSSFMAQAHWRLPQLVACCSWPHGTHSSLEEGCLGWTVRRSGMRERGGDKGPFEPPQTRMQTLTPGLARAGPSGSWLRVHLRPVYFWPQGGNVQGPVKWPEGRHQS